MSKEDLPTFRRTGAPRRVLSERRPSRRIVRADKPLTPAMVEFVGRYLASGNATQSYRASHPRATYATALCEGSKLLKDPRIATELRRWQEATFQKHADIAERVLEVMAHQAFTTIGDFYDVDGKLIPLHELPREIAQALKKYRRRQLRRGTGCNRRPVGEVVEIELVDRMSALRALAQQLGLFPEHGQVHDHEVIVRAMREARERARRR